MKLTIRTTGAEMLLSLEASDTADFGAGLGVLLDRAADLRLLLLALDGDSDDGDDTDNDSDGGDDTDNDSDGGNPDDDPSGETASVDRLLAGLGISSG